jgi:hypothetical protein
LRAFSEADLRKLRCDYTIARASRRVAARPPINAEYRDSAVAKSL